MWTRILSSLLFTLTFALTLAAQQTQTIKGRLVDAQSEMPLIGATVELLTPPGGGTTTDVDGYFRLENIPVGRHELRLSYIGYQVRTLPNVMVTAGKEVVINTGLEESVTELNEVVVRAETDKTRPVNELATVSARTFSPQDVNRFAGGRADVSRLVGNLAGVSTADDSRNDIVIRGNSPAGLLWQLEGIPIPNPNHFSTLGTTGGPVSALNPNMLANSDFITSAFPAEYGNALSGVFDLRLRTGNRDRFEFMGQVGSFSGVEVMAEGPLRDGKGSFVASFRNSFVGLASSLGIPIGTEATPDYRDLTFNIDFGTGRAGRFSVFGIGGTSRIDFLGAEIDTTDLFADPTRDAFPRSQFGVAGVRHNLITGKNTYVRTVVSGSLQRSTFEEFGLDDEIDGLLMTDVEDQTLRYSLKSYLNSKVNSRLTVRAGIQTELIDLTTVVDDRNGQPDRDGDGLRDLNRLRDFDGNFSILQAFAQARYKLSDQLVFNGGLHGQYFSLSEATALEPRLALEYSPAAGLRLTAGYGRHSQVPALPVFFFRDFESGAPDANQDLDFLRADHFVLGGDYAFAPNWRVKTEVYYQRLFDVPVDNFSSSFSLLNAGADFVFPERGNLVNDGTGENYGVEVTLERFFSAGWYTLVTGSIFDSRYAGSDGVERNTAFNNGYVANVLLGKEWAIGKNKTNRFTIDTRLTTSGGRYDTPVDLEASRAAGADVRDESRAFTDQYDSYFRWDLKFGFQFNSPKRRLSQSFFIDLQNLTNRQNIFQRRYNPVTNQVNTVFQAGFFPDIQYRIQF
jgi:hypothetical protein